MLLARTLTATFAGPIIFLCTLTFAAGAADFTVLNERGEPLANVVISYQGQASEAAVTSGKAVIEQRVQQFLPRVSVVKPGTAIRFPNRDITQHHVYSFSEAKTFEIELFGGDEADAIVFDREGIVALGCNIHDWMLGFVFVTSAEFSTISDAAGKASLKGLPATSLELLLWHPAVADGLPIKHKVDLSAPASGPHSLRVEQTGADPLAGAADPLQGLFESAAE